MIHEPSSIFSALQDIFTWVHSRFAGSAVDGVQVWFVTSSAVFCVVFRRIDLLFWYVVGLSFEIVDVLSMSESQGTLQ